MIITHNQRNQQFETVIDGEKAELQYRIRENTIFYMHTWVPPVIEGKGVASALAKFGLDYALNNNFQIAIYCPFVVTYVKRHRDYLALLNTKFQKTDRFI